MCFLKNFWLTLAQDTMRNKEDYIDLGLSCTKVCKVLDQGLKEIESDELSKTMADAIDRLKAWIQLEIHISSGP